MTNPTLSEALRSLEDEAALYRRPDVRVTLSSIQRAALLDIERRITVLRQELTPA